MMFSIRSLGKGFARGGSDIPVFENISFDVPEGQFVTLCGPSGCGKTTLLRCLAGLSTPSAGEILFKGRDVDRPTRGVSMVFQDYGNSLFPWKTVLGNVLFAMHGTDATRRHKEKLAMDHLDAVGLAPHSRYHPWELSGGMQQRLAIARALASGAECLLMDEPFASLDAQTRAVLEDLLLDIWADGRRTVLFVTHDVDEAVYLADRILILGGEITTLVGDMTNDMARPRRQLATRGAPRFSELREAVHRHLAPGAGA
jgi:NitT/TauT family transport system ATP-binding protein